MTDMRFEVQPRDPGVFGGVVGVLLLTGLLVCLVPARRATRADPLRALRTEQDSPLVRRARSRRRA